MYILKPWILSTIIGTIFFVIGQIFLRKSFDKDQDYISTAICFYIFSGIAASIYLLVLYFKQEKIEYNFSKLKNAALAGIIFFIGGTFWIHSISTKAQLGNIRIIMAGFEMFLLFLAGFLLFNETIKLIQLSGVILILIGIYIIGAY